MLKKQEEMHCWLETVKFGLQFQTTKKRKKYIFYTSYCFAALLLSLLNSKEKFLSILRVWVQGWQYSVQSHLPTAQTDFQTCIPDLCNCERKNS